MYLRKSLIIVKKIISTIVILNVFNACESKLEPYSHKEYTYSPPEIDYEITHNDTIEDDIVEDTLSRLEFEVLTDLEMDSNGYYRLQIDTTNWQTLYRFSGRVTRDSLPCRVIEFGWYSAHHWIIGDTLGYIIANNGLSDDMVYVGYDTTYLTWFNGFEVPIVNGSSYSNDDGEVNTMIAPVQTMIGDTINISYGFWDNWRLEETRGFFEIILD
tara:strand:- start:654 stop:1295 length:642 start_codon:yes stop_codon:yes gene_type:complete